MNRHNWTSDEDKSLRQVVDKNGSEDWTKNAQLLRQISKTAQQKKRTGKQCRQRWYNHLDPNVIKSQWKIQQQIRLFEMHKIHGNKWKQLTKYLPGRTDNDIKNHFYSTLRRSLRRLNKYIGQKNSTNQMRQIKPSVLTFIINHIYSQELGHNYNKNLLNSLKQLPQLIFKFSSFKPVKQNMDKKVDQNMRDKIITILNLVDQFKQLHSRQKNQEGGEQNKSNKTDKKNNKNSNIKIENKTTMATIRSNIINIPNLAQQNQEQMQIQQQQQQNQNQQEQLKQQYNSQEYGLQHINFQKSMNQFSHTRNYQRQFSPIVTIQRKPSNFQPKQNSKKLILIPKTQQKMQLNQKQQQDNSQRHTKYNKNVNNIKLISFQPFNQFKFEDQGLDNQLISLDQPSVSINQNSNIFNDLIVIGKHIQPIQYLPTNNQHPNDNQIDQILYQNYQQ